MPSQSDKDFLLSVENPDNRPIVMLVTARIAKVYTYLQNSELYLTNPVVMNMCCSTLVVCATEDINLCKWDAGKLQNLSTSLIHI